MKIPHNFNQIDIHFFGRRSKLDLSDLFYGIADNRRKIVNRHHRIGSGEILSQHEFEHFEMVIQKALLLTEPLITAHFERNKEETEPLLSREFHHYDIEIDLISYGQHKKDEQLPIAVFDLLFDCMDKEDSPIFMYDGRGCYSLRFELNRSYELKVIENE